MMMSKAEQLAMKDPKNFNFGGLASNAPSLLRKGDYVPEIFFMGQIVGGQDFNVQDDGVFVECFLNTGEDWEMFEGNPLSVPI